jgi:hypothetical protein
MTVAVNQVVFIGPVCTGKSTLLRLVADRVDAEAVDLDDVANPYYEEVGRGFDALQEIGDRVGFLASYGWWQEGHSHAVRRSSKTTPMSHPLPGSAVVRPGCDSSTAPLSDPGSALPGPLPAEIWTGATAMWTSSNSG